MHHQVGPARPGAKPVEEVAKPARKKAEKSSRVKTKIDPKYLAAARELRDRYLEHVNDRMILPEARGKYDVSRMLPATATAMPAPPMRINDPPQRQLPSAA